MEKFQNRFLDEGLDGIVLYPGLETPPNFIGKIGADRVLEEYQNIKKISELGLDLPIRIRGFKIRELTTSEKNAYLEFMKNSPSYSYLKNQTIYQLELPYIKGENLYDDLDQYRTTYYEYGRTNHMPEIMDEKHLIKYVKSRVISISDFVFFYNRLYELKEKIRYMNNISVFHNDINEGNIMIDENGDLILIDFSRATIGYKIRPEDEDEEGEIQYWPDEEKMNFIIESFIWMSCQNPILYAYFAHRNIFSSFHFEENSQTLKNELKDIVDSGMLGPTMDKDDIFDFSRQFF